MSFRPHAGTLALILGLLASMDAAAQTAAVFPPGTVTATDSAGNIYAAAKATGKSGYIVQTSKIGTQGKPIWSQTFNFGGLSVPAAIVVDAAGNAYVGVNDLDVAGTVVIKYDYNGVFISSRSLPYQGPAFSPLLSAMVLDPGSLRLYAAETFIDPAHNGMSSALAVAYDLSLNTVKVQTVNDGPATSDESGAIVLEPSGRVMLGLSQYGTGNSSASYAVAEFSPSLGQLLSETAYSGSTTLTSISASNAGLPPHGSRATQLNDLVSRFHSNDRTIAAALDGAVDSTNDDWRMSLNVGIVYMHDPALDIRSPNRLQIDLTSATVRDVLNALTAADTNYYWMQDGTVIDVIPHHAEPKSLDAAALLEQKLPSFSVQNENMVEAVASLLEQAQAQGLTGLSGPKRPRASHEVDGWFSDDEKISLSLTGQSVRQCLNAIIAADSPARWMAFPRGKSVRITAVPKHEHRYYQRVLSPQEAVVLKTKYPDGAPKIITPAARTANSGQGGKQP